MSEVKQRPDEPGHWWWWSTKLNKWVPIVVADSCIYPDGRYVKVQESPPPKPVVLPHKTTAFTAVVNGDRAVGFYVVDFGCGRPFRYATERGEYGGDSPEVFLESATDLKWIDT